MVRKGEEETDEHGPGAVPQIQQVVEVTGFTPVIVLEYKHICLKQYKQMCRT